MALTVSQQELVLHDRRKYHLDTNHSFADWQSLRIAHERPRAESELFSPWEFLGRRNEGPEIGLVYASVFWPELIDVQGLILLKEMYDESYLQETLAVCGYDQVESTINTVYLYNIFASECKNYVVGTWEALGSLICKTWHARAISQFPDRKFIVEFNWYIDDGAELSDPGVTMRQVR
jgi:hypothetical protein